jgi:hypothetical protein
MSLQRSVGATCQYLVGVVKVILWVVLYLFVGSAKERRITQLHVWFHLLLSCSLVTLLTTRAHLETYVEREGSHNYTYGFTYFSPARWSRYLRRVHIWKHMFPHLFAVLYSVTVLLLATRVQRVVLSIHLQIFRLI